MFNLKVSGIVAGIAFVLSFIIGMISGISMTMLIMRAILFSVLFFVISALIKILVSRFLPELLQDPQEEGGLEGDSGAALRSGYKAGSRVNIIEGDDNFSPVEVSRPPVTGAQPDESEEGLGNISDLLGKIGINYADNRETGMDQNDQDSYTGDVGLGVFSASSLASSHMGGSLNKEGTSQANPSKKVSPDSAFGNTSSSMEALPDLESMAGIFGDPSEQAEAGAGEVSASNPVRKPVLKKQTSEWSGDFNPRDLAEGLRTVLSKEKEG